MVFYFFICVLSKFKSVLPILLILTSNITLHYISANVDTFIIHAFIFYYHCPVILLKKNKKGLIPQMDSAQIVIFVFVTIIIVEINWKPCCERYIKTFDGWHQSAHRHISKRERALRCQVHLRGHE